MSSLAAARKGLVPYSPALQARFEKSHQPDTWGGLPVTPWYLSLQVGLPAAGK